MISITGFDELKQRLDDMTDPHGVFLKEFMLNNIIENVPEAATVRDKIAFVNTEKAFNIEFGDIEPELMQKIKSYFESVSTSSPTT